MKNEYTLALAKLKQVGCAQATGESLRAMYAQLISNTHGGAGIQYFEFLKRFGAEPEITTAAKALLKDRAAAWDVVMGLEPKAS